MNKARAKFFAEFVEWLERANSNRYLNTVLLSIIILSVLGFFMMTFPDSENKMSFLILPVVSGMDLYFLGSKNHIIRETANFFAALLFIGFILCAIALIFMGLVIARSL
jgi:hypothetical protein